MFRMKHMRLGGWDRLHQCRRCPHCPLLGALGSTTSHTVWDCEAAQGLWRHVRAYWQQLGAWETASEDELFRDACLRLHLTRVPTSVWTMIPLQAQDPSDAAGVAIIHEVLAELWQRHSLIAYRLIWRWRCGLHDPDNKWSVGQVLALWSAEAHGSLLSMLDYARATDQFPLKLSILAELSARPRVEAELSATDTVLSTSYVLFFDGGSRGNPAPGGAGAVIVATDAHGSTARIVWAAAVSYAAVDMTNTRAEYFGAIAGLRAAWQNQWKPLEVVGDSALILRQLRDYRMPLNTKLRPLYATARVLADKLGVSRWHRHYRAHNKMADAAANVAMDSRSSVQAPFPTQRKELEALTEHLSTGIQKIALLFYWRQDFEQSISSQ